MLPDFITPAKIIIGALLIVGLAPLIRGVFRK